MKNKTLITTAIDYTNDVIHIGHAYEKLLADAVVRYHRLLNGDDTVYFVTGTDEHGNTNFKASQANGVSPNEHVDTISQKNKEQLDKLNISYQRFIRTTDTDHIKQASEFFTKSYDNGDIYKASYEGLYCDGCEAYKTITELVDGKCPNHLSLEIQKLQEENYFFKWTKYGPFLKQLIESDTLKVLPEGKKKEMLAFIQNGLTDIPVSRPKYKLSWGIEVPFDETQVIYVWFDALINYLTAGEQVGFWNSDTQIVHFIGKDVNRWHSLLWPAMLKSAGYPLPDVVYVHGFINLDGKKISKSLGNVIRPSDLVEKYKTDAVRYYFLKYGPIVEDCDISISHFEETYNSDLANGLGNTFARLTKLAQNSEFSFDYDENLFKNVWEDYTQLFNIYRVDLVLQKIWGELSNLDKHINEHEPWAITDKEKLRDVLTVEINALRRINVLIKPFLPETANLIQTVLQNPSIKTAQVLFPRI